MTTYRRLKLPSLADDLEEVLIPVDRGDRVGPAVAPPRPVLCPLCGRALESDAALGGHLSQHRRPRLRRVV